MPSTPFQPIFHPFICICLYLFLAKTASKSRSRRCGSALPLLLLFSRPFCGIFRRLTSHFFSASSSLSKPHQLGCLPAQNSRYQNRGRVRLTHNLHVQPDGWWLALAGNQPARHWDKNVVFSLDETMLTQYSKPIKKCCQAGCKPHITAIPFRPCKEPEKSVKRMRVQRSQFQIVRKQR